MARRILTLLSVAGLALTAATVSAQTPVFSVNSVGYVKRDLVAGFTMISNPLNVTSNGVNNNKLNVLIPTAPTGSIVWKFVNGGFQTVGQYADGFGWFPTTGTLEPGQGGFIFVPQAASVVFSGEVLQGALSVPVASGFNIVSSKVPQAASISALGFVGMPGDVVYVFNPGTQNYSTFNFVGGTGWFPGSVNGPTIPAGGSFWVFNAGAPRSWDRNFSISN